MRQVFLFIFFSFLQTLPAQKLDYSLPIPCVIREPSIDTTNAPILILMHGYGSNERDLESLSNQLPDKYRIYFLRAPIDMGHDQFVWYPVDFGSGKPHYDSVAAEKSRLLLIQFIEALKSKPTNKKSSIILGGFSQGGILSFSVGLTRPDLVKGILVMSGRILDEIKNHRAPKEKLKHLKIFMSHGSKDDVLNVSYAREAFLYLSQLKIMPVYREFRGGHSINHQMLQEISKWLQH